MFESRRDLGRNLSKFESSLNQIKQNKISKSIKKQKR